MARTTVPNELVAVNAIQGTLIADNAITAVHIATNAVSGTLIADNAVTSTHIAQNNVTATQILQNTITVTQLADDAVETAKINASAVTTAKINNGAVTADKLAANSVTSAKIVNGTIVAADLADDAVTIAKMAALARGKIIYGDSSGAPAALALGSNGQVLKSDGTDIAWATLSTGVDGISSSADATAITIDSSERVGIGVGSPSAKLQVDGEVRIQSSTEDGTSLFSIYNENTNPDSEQFFIAMNGSSVEMGNARGNALDFFTSDTRRMRITSGGYVGVGTTSPQGELHLVGATGAPVRLYLSDVDDGTGAADSLLITKSGATAYIYNRDDGDLRLGTNDDNDMLTIDTTGQIGIGTTSPNALLNMVSASSPTFRIKDTTNNCEAMLYAQDANAHFGTSSNHPLIIDTNNTERMRITADGKVGIGDTSPQDYLEINGSGSGLGGLTISNSTHNHAALSFARSGAATARIYITEPDATHTSAMHFQTSDADGSAENLVTAMTITERGTFGMGQGSGGLAGSIIINNDGGTGTIDNAYYNTALGWEAADDLTSGDSNTIMGNQAGYKLNSGSNNTFVGRMAGETVTTGSHNTAVGYNAMGDGTCTGSYNVAMGYEALHNTTSGYENVCIGRDAGHDITSGYHNVSVGHESLTKMQSANQCTAVGFQALEKAYAHSNVGIGYKAGEDITSGTNNICIGKESGTGNSPSGSITTGSNTISLGDDNIGALYCTQSSINTSDRRDKADITNFTAGLDFIKKMQPVTYKWDRRSWYLPRDEDGNITDDDITKVTRNGSKKENITHVGFIAQDVETLEKEIGYSSDNTNRLLTNLTEDGNRYGMKYERLVTVLVNAVKELDTKLTAAEARIKTLEDA